MRPTVSRLRRLPTHQVPVHVVPLAAVLALDDDAEHVTRLEQRPEALEIGQIRDQLLALLRAQRRIVGIVVQRQRQMGSRVLGIACEGVEGLVRHVTQATRAVPSRRVAAAVLWSAAGRRPRAAAFPAFAGSCTGDLASASLHGLAACEWRRARAMAEVEIGIGKSGRRAYGFDDVAIVPSRRTRDPEDVSITWEIDAFRFELPLLASAMDGVVSPRTAIEIGRLGGVGVLNLEGLWTRYADPDPILEEISPLDDATATKRMQELYAEPIKPELIGQRIQQVKDAGVTTAASLTPQRVKQFSPIGARSRRRPVRHPGHGRQRGARFQPSRAAEPEELHR